MATTTLFSESEDLLDIRKDNIFKAVFTKDTSDSRRALSGLVSAIVGREMEVLDITANEPAPEDTRDRQIRFDINCKTPDGEKVNVEMCLNPNSFEPVRLEFHAARLFITQDIMGKDKSFDDLKRTYQIAILGNKTYFPDGDVFTNSSTTTPPARGHSAAEPRFSLWSLRSWGRWRKSRLTRWVTPSAGRCFSST